MGIRVITVRDVSRVLHKWILTQIKIKYVKAIVICPHSQTIANAQDLEIDRNSSYAPVSNCGVLLQKITVFIRIILECLINRASFITNAANVGP